MGMKRLTTFGSMTVVQVEPGHRVVDPVSGREEIVTEREAVYHRDTIYVTQAVDERLKRQITRRPEEETGR